MGVLLVACTDVENRSVEKMRARSSYPAEEIESFVAASHEYEWYNQQMLAWQKIVDENPQDQWAWRNLFRASYYNDQFNVGWGENQDESNTAHILRKMEVVLPDSYVLDFSDYGQYGNDCSRKYMADVIMHLVKESKRPAYFSTDMLSFADINKDSLYNEGLLLKYSDHPYDNFAVAVSNPAWRTEAHPTTTPSHSFAEEPVQCSSIQCDGISYSLLTVY